jgi:hypothetical protein
MLDERGDLDKELFVYLGHPPCTPDSTNLSFEAKMWMRGTLVNVGEQADAHP